jgi:hypothetical protein
MPLSPRRRRKQTRHPVRRARENETETRNREGYMAPHHVTDEVKKGIIDEATPLRIGLVIALMSGLVSVVWWASATSSKLETIISQQTTFNFALAELKTQETALTKQAAEDKMRAALNDESLAKDIAELRVKMQKINDEGSPITDKRLTVIERELSIRNGTRP